MTGGSPARSARARLTGSRSAVIATTGPSSSSSGRAPPPTLAIDRVTAADEQTGLGATEELVARTADDRGAGCHRARDRGLVGDRRDAGRAARQDAGADIVDDGRPERAQGLDRHVLDEADGAEVRRVDAEDCADRRGPGVGLDVGVGGGVGDCAFVVLDARTVRRTDLDQLRARLRDHVGDAKPPADLDELAAGHDDRAPGPGQRRGGEEHGRGSVVDGDRGVGACELGEQRLDVVVPASARAAVEIELEVRVPVRGLGDRVASGDREWCPAEIRVDDHAGGVEDSPQRRQLELVEQRSRSRRQLVAVVVVVVVVRSGAPVVGEDLAAALVDRAPRGDHGEGMRGVEGRSELVDRRERPQLSCDRGVGVVGWAGVGGVPGVRGRGVGGVPSTHSPSSFFQMGA